MIALGVLAHVAVAHAECGNFWSWTDLVGIAADGSYITRTSFYASMGQLDRKQLNELTLASANSARFSSVGEPASHELRSAWRSGTLGS